MSGNPPAPATGMVIYRSQDGDTRLNVRLQERTVWLTQAMMADLYQSTKQNISLHLRKIFAEGELHEESVVKEYLTTATDGKTLPNQALPPGSRFGGGL